MEIRENCRYTRTHEWVRIEGDEAIVGITDWAQEQSGDIVYVELPEPGADLSPGEEVGFIDSSKATSTLYSPLSGTVTRINENLADHPELVNSSPYDEGWMYAVRFSNRSEYDALMDAGAYAEFVKSEEAGH